MQEHQVNPADNRSKEPHKSSPKFSARYLGSMSVSRLYSQTVQPWVMAEIHRKRRSLQDVVIEVCGESVIVHKRADQGQLPILFQHHLKGVTRFAKMHQDAKCFAYLTRYEITADFQCHVYLTDFEAMIPQLFKAIREASKNVFGKPGVLDTPGHPPVDSKSGGTDGGDSDRCKSMFEVKYLGRAKLGSRRVTSDYIDNLAERLITRKARSVSETLEEVEQERQSDDTWRERHASGASVKSLPDTLKDGAEDLVTENNLKEQIEMMKNSGLRSCPFVPSADSTLGSTVVSGSTSLQTEASEHVGQPISGDAHSHSVSKSSSDSLNTSFEQKLNQLNFGKGQEHNAVRSSTTDGATRRRHSSQSDDRSWSGSKFTFQDPAHDRQHQDSIGSQDSICSIHRQHEGSRIMVLQIGQQNICLISLDKKVSVLDCKFTDISFVSQGSHKQDFFGIVVRDSGTTFFCYILRCLSQAVVEEILSTLQTAFTTACSKRGDHSSCTVEAAAPTTQNQVCSTCPLHHFHKICQEIHTLSSQAAYELIVKKVHCLPDKEFNELNHVMQTESPESFEETLEVMMIFLRQLCERKQINHVHISETSRYIRSDQMTLLEEKQGLLEGLKNKARKSLTTSFEHLLTRGKKKDEASDTFRQRSWTTDSETSWTSRESSSSTTSTPDVSPMPSPRRKETYHDFTSPPSSPRRRSATMDNISHSERQLGRRRDVNHNTTASPMKTMFLLSTSSPQQSESLSSSTAGSSPLEDTNLLTPLRRPSSSWRKAIFNKVCTPQHSVEFGEECPQPPDGKLHNTADVRAMWRKLILESLLLIKMEKENHSIRARQEEDGAMLYHKLEYQELTPCLKEITCTWEKMLAVNDGDEEEVGKALMEEVGKTVPKTTLLEYVKKGVPRSLRGQIWLFLMQQQQMCNTVPDSSCESASYEDLLKQLTMHQHAILIDLGRTFPSHPYFSKSLGTGQLELFNLLKAYSLLDSEVGYCQGLSFIVGMLLMHMEEISAFHVLKYLMYDLGLRKQFRPNMTALQLKLYQLTRLLHDRHKNVYDHFETHEISPTLYAAPWFLTMFASQFPLGFVARVFDMIFIQGIDALFKVALTLIGSHNALILQCDSFETIVDFLKITLPEMVQVQMERIINQAFELDLDRELQQYEVEYYVLSEEMTFTTAHHQHHSQQKLHHDKNMSPPAGLASDRLSRPTERRRSVIDMEMVYRLESQNLALKHQNTDLLEKLEQAQSQRQSSEVSVLTQQIEMDKLKSHIRSLELERAALLTAVAKLRQLIPHEALQNLQLSLPATSTSPLGPSTSPLGLGNASDRKTFHGQGSLGTDLTWNESATAQLLGAYQVASNCDTNSVLASDGTSSLLSSYSEAILNSNKNCTDLSSSVHILASSEAKGSSISAHHNSVSVTSQTHEAATQLPATTASPPYTLTSSSLTSTSDISRSELHSQRTRASSAGVESLSHAGLASQLPSSSSCAAQTCTPRNISNTSNNILTVGAILPEKRQNTVTVVVQQSTTMKNSQTSPSSQR